MPHLRTVKSYNATVNIPFQDKICQIKMSLPDFYRDSEIIDMIKNKLRSIGYVCNNNSDLCSLLLYDNAYRDIGCTASIFKK